MKKRINLLSHTNLNQLFSWTLSFLLSTVLTLKANCSSNTISTNVISSKGFCIEYMRGAYVLSVCVY